MRIVKIFIKTIVITIIIFYWTIARHEGSHALLAYLEGADVYELKLLPGIHKDLGFYFAYVKHSEVTTWLTEAAPYFSDILILLIGSIILFRKSKSKYFNEIILLGFVSPIIDLLYNYQGGLWRLGTDVSDLLNLLPKTLVHFTFIVTIIISILLLVFFKIRRVKITSK